MNSQRKLIQDYFQSADKRQLSEHRPQKQQSNKLMRRSTSANPSFKKKPSINSIITGNCRLDIQVVREPSKPLKSLKVYVEIFSGPHASDRNISDCNDECLLCLGAKLVKSLSKHTSVVVWQYGSLATLDKAKEFNVPTVNPCWINECLTFDQLIPYEKYPVIKLSKEELQQLQRRDRPQYKKPKQSQDIQAKEQEMDQFIQFRMRTQIREFQNQLSLLLQMPNRYVTSSKDKLSSIMYIIETIQEEEARNYIITQQQPTQNGANIQPSLQVEDPHVPMKIAIHKSCIGNISKFIDQLNLKPKYTLVYEEHLKLQADILLVCSKDIKIDLLYCTCLLNQQCKLVDQQWIINSNVQPLCIDKFILKLELPKLRLFPFYCNIYQPKIKIQELKQINEVIVRATEQVIQHFGGKKHAEIVLVMKTIQKQSIQSILNKHTNGESLKLIHVQWIYACIEQGKLVGLDNFLIQF